MYNSVIAGYSRSPFAMANKGKLIGVKPVNLLAQVIKNLVPQSKINPNFSKTYRSHTQIYMLKHILIQSVKI